MHSVKKGRDDSITLKGFHFQIGDMIDIAIQTTASHKKPQSSH